MIFKYRQGDVALVRIARAALRNVAGYGNRFNRTVDTVLSKSVLTGHAHTVSGNARGLVRFYRSTYRWSIPHPGTSRKPTPARPSVLLVGKGGAILSHDEHGPIDIAPGCYRVVRQEEWQSATGYGRTPGVSRGVID